MNTNYSEIVMIVDRSGSMQALCEDAIGGFNTFLEEQKKVPGGANLTLVLFNEYYELVHDAVSLAVVELLDSKTYVPMGTTALLDAVGKTIDAVGVRLAAMPEADRPDKVVVAILTDGLENSSKHYSREKIFDMIKLQRENYQWEFFFLAANQDAIQAAFSMAIPAQAATSFAATPEGTRQAFASVSRSVTSSRKS